MIKVQVNRIHSLTGHRDCVYTLQPAHQDNIFFSGAGDGMIVQWNLENPSDGELIAKLPNSVYALHQPEEDEVLIAGHNYEGVHLLDWRNKKEIGSLKLTAAAIFDIESFGKATLVATGDGTVVNFNRDNLQITNKIQASEKSARTIAINRNSGEAAVGYSDNFIRIFDLDTLRLKHQWQAHENSIFTIQYSPDFNFLFSGSRDARFKVWDVGVNYTKVSEVVAHLFAINHIEFSPDGKHFVTCSMDKSIKVWNTEELKLLKVIDRARHAGHGTSVNKLLWTNYKQQLVSASDDRTISVWNINFEEAL